MATNQTGNTCSEEISTAYWRKPIPDRCCDWIAVLANYEPGQPIGEGETEAEAIADLQEQLS